MPANECHLHQHVNHMSEWCWCDQKMVVNDTICICPANIISLFERWNLNLVIRLNCPPELIDLIYWLRCIYIFQLLWVHLISFAFKTSSKCMTNNTTRYTCRRLHQSEERSHTHTSVCQWNIFVRTTDRLRMYTGYRIRRWTQLKWDNVA